MDIKNEFSLDLPSYISSGIFPGKCRLVDLNGDHILDIVTLNLGVKGDFSSPNWQTSIGINLGIGDGKFTETTYQNIGNSPACAQGLEVVDMNNDGILDMVVSLNGQQSVAVCFGDGLDAKGIPTYHSSQFINSAWPQQISTADLNNDGYNDIIIPSPAINGNPNVIEIYINDGGGHFNNSFKLDTIAETWRVQCADINGDGKVDIIESGVQDYVYHPVQIFYNTGQNNSQMFSQSQELPDAPRGFTIGDINGDGRLDIATADFWGQTSNIFLNIGNNSDGSANLVLSQSLTFNTQLCEVYLKDLNNDGKLDLLTYSPFDFGRCYYVSLNDGNGKFNNTYDFQLSAGGYTVAFGDLNGDKLPDLVIPSVDSNNLTLVSQRWEEGLLNRILADFRPIL